jgi:hypothetical protein
MVSPFIYFNFILFLLTKVEHLYIIEYHFRLHICTKFCFPNFEGSTVLHFNLLLQNLLICTENYIFVFQKDR